MTAILLFSMLHIFALVSFCFRNKLIAGMRANSKVDDVKALAHLETLLTEAKTAQEKMVYLRMINDVRDRIISDVDFDFDIECLPTAKAKAAVKASEARSKIPAPQQEAANIVSLADRRRSNAGNKKQAN